MGRAVGKIAIGAAIIGLAFATGGASLVPTVTAGGAAGAAAVTAAGYLSTTALGSALLMAGAGSILSGVAMGVGIGPKVPASQLSRLNLSFDPDASRKIVFGETAMGTDVVYYELSGTDQEYIDYIIVAAAHKVTSIDSIYSDDKLMWSSSSGVQSTYNGYLTVTAVLEGNSGNAVSINGGTNWGTSCRLTGCAYVHLRIKRTGNTKKAESPFVGGLPPRLTIIGKGMPVYDARYDSTRGGSGALRADDQTTWQFTVSGNDIGKNPAAQLYSYLLGWKIGGVLSVGAGMPPARLDFDDQITAANICDEDVAITGGGTHNRYETHGMFSDDDSPASVIEVMCTHMNADPRDVSGSLGIRMSYDDLSGSLVTLTEDDLLGPVEWDSGPGLNDLITSVSGRCTDATATALYQLAPYTKRSVTPADGIERPMTLDLPMFQDFHRPERVAEQVLQRSKWQGRLTATFGPRALAVSAGQPVRLTFAPRGFSSKLFRVERQEIKVVMDEGVARVFCPMTLVEESSSIYTAPATAAPGSNVAAPSFDPLNNPLAITEGTQIGVANGATVGGTYGVDIYRSGAVVVEEIDALNAYAPDANLFADPNFIDLAGPGWSSVTAGIVNAGSAEAPSIRLSGGGVQRRAISQAKPCRPGQRIDAGLEVYGEPGTTNYCAVAVFFLDAAGTQVGSTEYALIGDISGLTAGVWTPKTGSSPIAPAGTHQVRVAVESFSANTEAWNARLPRAYIAELATANLNTSGRATRSRLMSTSLIIGVANTVSAPCTAADQGGSTGVTISIPAHSRKISDTSGAETISYNAGALSGRSYSTTYHIYADDPDLAGGAVTYQSTTSADDLHGAGRYHVTTIATPTDGGAATGGSGGGGSVRPLNPGEQIP